MSARDAVIARIRKCLALSQSANEHEAAAALAKARALMDEHEVSADDVRLADVAEAAAKGGGARKPAAWETTLALTVARAFHCRFFLDGAVWRFVGLDPAPELAGYAFAVLFRQLKRARAEYVGRQLRRCKLAAKRRRADLFCEGWASAVYAKVRHLAPPTAAAEAAAKYLELRHPDLVALESRTAKEGKRPTDDYWRGRAAGRAAELHGGVGAAPSISALPGGGR